MHVAPAEFRSVRRDGVTLHFAVLESRVWVVAEFPASGSRGTFAEEWCERPHWAITIAGDVELDFDGEREAVPPGTAFHVPADVRHRIIAGPSARTAGLEPLPRDAPLDEAALREAGFEIARSSSRLGPGAVASLQPRPVRSPGAGEIVAQSERMGELLLTRTRFGRRAGYTGQLCDLPHWGVVTMGSIAIEWEDDVEVVGAGDVYHCPAGPPGHRIEAAEAATVIDFTPIDAMVPGGRVALWRASAAEAALRQGEGDSPRMSLLGLAALG
jgi:quercetin dioxygenase-like cupin family protein